MLDFDELRDTLNNTDSKMKKNISHVGTMAKDAGRVSNIAGNASSVISDIDRKFEQATKLTGIDVTLLFLSVALHLVRQYFQPKISFRADDTTAAEPFKKNEEKILKHFNQENESILSDIHHPWYNPSLEEVMYNKVPFDIQFGGGKEGFDIFSLPKEVSDVYKGISPKGMRHRTATLGHDPILGWIFGTANLATATLTTWKFNSYHVKFGLNANGVMCPKIANNAQTSLIFEHIKKKISSEDMNDKIIIAVSLIREWIHLKSDQFSNSSLAIPFTALLSPKFAEHLASFGLDMANIGNIKTVGEQAFLASMVNMIIGMIHGLINGKEIERQNYDFVGVRTRKILIYSNIIASASNLLVVAIMSAVGVKTGNPETVKKALSYLDIGGLLVTIYRIVTDSIFIGKIKQEFLEKEFYNVVMGDDFDF